MANTGYGSTTRDLAENVGTEAERVASDVAEGVSDVASRVQERASALGRKAVDQFNATTGYFRDNDVKDIMEDVNSWVKAHPTQALITAAAVGFVAAALIRRR
jgi:ElaB/YqjD/DUF883 family membrane-anchored ribosome-binding protein